MMLCGVKQYNAALKETFYFIGYRQKNLHVLK